LPHFLGGVEFLINELFQIKNVFLFGKIFFFLKFGGLVFKKKKIHGGIKKKKISF